MGLRVQQVRVQPDKPSDDQDGRPRRARPAGAHRRRAGSAQRDVHFLQGPAPPRPRISPEGSTGMLAARERMLQRGSPSETTLPLPVSAADPENNDQPPRRRMVTGVGIASAALVSGLLGFALADSIGNDVIGGEGKPLPQAQPVQPKVAPPAPAKPAVPKKVAPKPAKQPAPEPVVRQEEPVVTEVAAPDPAPEPRSAPKPTRQDRVWRVSGDLSDDSVSDYSSQYREMQRQAADYMARFKDMARKYERAYRSYD